MNPEQDKPSVRRAPPRSPLLIIIVIVVFIILAWAFARAISSRYERQDDTRSNSTATVVSGNDTAPAGDSGIRDLVNYQLPSGWREETCEGSEKIYILSEPAAEFRCDINPDAPITLSVDVADSDDCNDLQNVQFVNRHVCISLYIHDMKSLQASTTYNKQSSFGQETTFDNYFIDTGEGIIKLEYMYRGPAGMGDLTRGFDELAKSVSKK